jgi:hypothetical protein
MLYVHDAQGQQRGPFDAATILAMLQRGEIDDRALCCASGETQWVNVREHPAIAAIATQPVGSEPNAPRSSWGAPATPWSVGLVSGGSTWGPTNTVPPGAGFGGAPAAAAASVTEQQGGAVAAAEDEAAEDAALGIPVEVTRPPSVAPAPMGSGPPGAASAQGGALQGARFVSGAGATTSEHLEAKRAARAEEGRSRTKLVVGSMIAIGVVVVGGLAAVGWSRRSAARQELARASVAQGQVLTSELRGDSLQVEFALASGTSVRGTVEPSVHCERADSAANAGAAQGERHERWSCDVSSAPFGEVQRLRFTLAAEHGTSEVVATYTRPVSLEVTRDAATGVSRIACRGVRCAGTFDGRAGLVLTVPARTTLWLGGEQHEVSTDGETRVPLRWDALFARVPTAQLFARDGVVPVELRLSIRGAPTLTARLEMPASAARQELFRQWRPGQPALLPGEIATGAGRRTIVAQHGEAFGGPQQLRDIDLVAFLREQGQTKVCRYTIAPRERRTMTLRRVDAVLSVFERRTARVVGTRRFNAPWAECPAEFSETEVATTRFDEESVRRWLRAFVGA